MHHCVSMTCIAWELVIPDRCLLLQKTPPAKSAAKSPRSVPRNGGRKGGDADPNFTDRALVIKMVIHKSSRNDQIARQWPHLTMPFINTWAARARAALKDAKGGEIDEVALLHDKHRAGRPLFFADNQKKKDLKKYIVQNRGATSRRAASMFKCGKTTVLRTCKKENWRAVRIRYRNRMTQDQNAFKVVQEQEESKRDV